MENSNSLNTLQIEAARRIYGEIVSFLNEFLNTDGFNHYWFEIADKLKEKYERNYIDFVLDELEKYVDDRYNKVVLAYEKEYIILKNHPLYQDLEDLLYSEKGLSECYVGKLSYAYRFESQTEDINGNITGKTTYEDYEITNNRVRSVFDKYF